uniref:Golgi associated RAB2 interactor protein-like Rab2B-binding domain-containing protein n=1 Tax=Latimeria chalumnae TaxID=7897 RepID=M3XHP9_LATCH|nr:PREDICTED: protein FAM71F2-like isoform X1 [Latimeria chalumnae]|eukprot:XP_014353381.1 PREDICTED: protein FAM71F2-like isoform X1 [Latimeria chalumnae]
MKGSREHLLTGYMEEAGLNYGVMLGVEGGALYQLLRTPEYNLFTESAMFESDFVQVTSRGALLDIHNISSRVTLGVTSSVPSLPLPNVLLIARFTIPHHGSPHKELTKLFPLKLVRLTVHKKELRLLKLLLANHRSYYLQLQHKHPDIVFQLWIRLVHILHSGLSITFKDSRIALPKQFDFINPSSSESSLYEHDIWEMDTELHSTADRKQKGGKRSTQQPRLLLEGTVSNQRSEKAESPSEESNSAKSDQAEWNNVNGSSLHECELCVQLPPDSPKEKKEMRPRAPSREGDLSYGLWERDTPAGMMPLSRLSSLIAVGHSLAPRDWRMFLQKVQRQK